MKKEKRTRSAKRDPAFIAIQRWAPELGRVLPIPR